VELINYISIIIETIIQVVFKKMMFLA